MIFSWLDIEKNMLRCSLSEDRKENIMARLYYLEGQDNEFAIDEFNRIYKEILDNQHDPIVNGTNYNQTDIQNHLKKLR